MLRLSVLLLVLAIVVCWMYFSMIRMPLKSYRGPLPEMMKHQQELAAELRSHVQALAGDIGIRNVQRPAGLKQSVEFLGHTLTAAGYTPRRQYYTVDGVECINVDVEITGTKRPDEIVIIGAHYDSCDLSPAANDNASGVAATLSLARQWIARPAPHRTLRFAFFVNEEPPYFMTERMGSLVYARACRRRKENIVGMVSLETIGYYSQQPGSQQYPITPIGWLYPDRGDFIAFVGNYQSRALVRRAIESFRRHVQFPSEGAALPGWIEGVGWSDHWSFWQAGYPGIMLTDTALFRYPHYHQVSDTPDKLDYDCMARVVDGVGYIISDLAGTADPTP